MTVGKGFEQMCTIKTGRRIHFVRFKCHPSRPKFFDAFERSQTRSILSMIIQYVGIAPNVSSPIIFYRCESFIFACDSPSRRSSLSVSAVFRSWPKLALMLYWIARDIDLYIHALSHDDGPVDLFE